MGAKGHKPQEGLTIGQKLVRLYKARGESQSVAAEGLGVGQGTFSDWVRDKYVPGLENVVAIAARYGVTLDWLVDPLAGWPAPVPSETRRHIERSIALLGEDEALARLMGAPRDQPGELFARPSNGGSKPRIAGGGS